MQSGLQSTDKPRLSRVLVFKETLLAPSETFVLAQAHALTRYESRLAGLEESRPSLRLQADRLLLSRPSNPLAAIRAKLYRRIGFAPVFHRRARLFYSDLIHAHFASGGRSALPLAASLNIPLVVTLHGADVTVHPSEPNRYKQLGDKARRFICVSQFIRDSAIAVGFPPEKLEVHYIGIDRSLFQPETAPATKHPSVLFIGRLVEKKGCAYLLRAMQLVQASHPECQLVIIGDGPLRAELEALAHELGVRANFRGMQPSQAVRDALGSARIFCAPSIKAANGDSEGLGMVFAEAQAMGVPVVSTLHGGIPEVVLDGVSGLLTPERDAPALAAALSMLLADEALWQRFHYAAMDHIERNFDLHKQTLLLEAIYDDVCGLQP